jgi:hypothetical protein
MLQKISDDVYLDLSLLVHIAFMKRNRWHVHYLLREEDGSTRSIEWHSKRVYKRMRSALDKYIAVTRLKDSIK